MNNPIDRSLILPTLAAGETLYSWCASVHRKTCSQSSIQISQKLFSNPHIARLHDFPGHLAELEKRTGNLLGDAQELALRHTLLGYFLAFIPAAQSKYLLVSAISSSVPDIKMRLGIPASGIGGYHPLKCCQECFYADIKNIGWPIWHVEHQLPSVLVCRKHHRPLLLRWEPKTPVHLREWITPSVKSSAQLFEIPIVSEQALSFLIRLADFSAQAASLPLGEMQSEKLSNTYRHWAFSNSGLSLGRSLRHSIMNRALNKSFNIISSTLSGMGPIACKLQLAPLIGSVARSKPKPVHPLKHLALIACMYESWDQFWSDYIHDFQHSTAIPASNDSPSASNQATAQFAQLVRESKLSIRQAAITVGISTTTGVRWAKIHDLPYTPRAQQLTPNYLEKVRDLLKLGKEKHEVIKLTKISSVSLNRLLTSEPNLRLQWVNAKFEHQRKINRLKFQAALASNPKLPMWLLRKIPDTGWSWLYKHDRAWLRDTSASHN